MDRLASPIRFMLRLLLLFCAGTALVSKLPAQESDWWTPWRHQHTNSRGTVYVHPFGVEPAFLERELLVDAYFTRGGVEPSAELALELEWAFTRRLGTIIELSMLRTHASGESAHGGVGDLAVAPRVLLIDADAWLLTANFELSFPTGDESRGLGGGEFAWAPSLSAWRDLGGGFQASLQLGVETGAETSESELFFGVSIAAALSEDHSHAEHAGPESAHEALEQTSLLMELTGASALQGGASHGVDGEFLLGFSHSLSEDWALRAGITLPFGGNSSFDHGFVIGWVRHF